MRRSLRPARLQAAALAAGLLVAIGLPSCGNSEFEAQTDLTTQGGPGSNFQGLGGQVLLIQSAPDSVAYQGVRRVERFTESPMVSYRERVAGDGAGGFQIEVIDVLSSSTDEATFRETQAQTKGFQHRYGGFRIQDAQEFQKNYQISILSNSEVVAGIPCHRWHVEQDVADANLRLAVDRPNHYLIDFDPSTGLVLRWQEIDGFGELVTRVAFESISYGEPTLAMHQTSLTETPLPLGDDAGDEVGFKPLNPKLLPPNFVKVQAAKVHDGQRLWVRQVYSDGLDTILLMNREPIQSAGATASTLGALVTGDRTVLMGTVNNVEVIAEGKRSLDEMQDFLSSCF